MEQAGSKIEHLAELVKPSLAYKDSFLEAEREFQLAGGVLENKVPYDGKLKRRYWIDLE